jgi:outer membrane receptor for ferrienterochelin and colicins
LNNGASPAQHSEPKRQRFGTGKRPVCGIVRDQQGLPVPGAKVVLLPVEKTEITDDSGRFCFASTEEGRRLLVIVEGFAEESRELEDMDRDPLELQFTVRPTFRQEVVVSAARFEQRLEDVPVRIDVVNYETIEALGATTLADALEFTTGVRVESHCQNCNFAQVRLLGLDGAYSQILVDGQPLISSLAQVYGIEQIPARMLERIEIIKGGGSALYGAGSVAGAINIVPRKPNRTGGLIENRLEWMEGLINHSHHASMDYVSKDHDTYLSLFGEVDRMKPLDFDGDGFTEVCKRKFEALGVRLDHRLLQGKAEFTLDFSRVFENRRGGNRLDLPEYMADIAEFIKSRRVTVATGWRHYIRRDLDYSFTGSVAYTKRDTYYGAGMDPNAYGDTDNPLIVLDGQMNHYRGRHIVSWGVQHSSDHLRDSQPGYGRYADDVYRNVGFFFQDSWSFGKGWEALYGFRIDKHSAVNSAILSPRAALQWSPAPILNFRGSFARGFRAPQVFDEDLHITQVGGEGSVIRNAYALKHETANSYMLGFEWTPKSGGHKGLVEINAFYTGLKDLFRVIDDDDPRTSDREFTRTNFGKASVRGFEVNLGYALGNRFKAEGGFVVQSGRFDQPEPDFGSRRFLRTPSAHGNLSLFWNQTFLGEFFIGLRYSGSMRLPHYAGYIPFDRLEKTEPYTVLDASISRAVPCGGDFRLVFTAGFKNLTNSYQRDLDQGSKRDAGYVYGPRFPRTFSAGLRVEF